MNELKFDENLAIREVLDDIVGMVDRREKLIQSAAEEAERSGDERMVQHVTKLEGLMSDFLTLFEPVLVKIRRYGDTLRDSISDSEDYLKSLVGIIDAGKGVEGTSATLEELERDADDVQQELELSNEVLGKIENLTKRTKNYSNQISEKVQPVTPAIPSTIREPVRREQRAVQSRNSGSYSLPGSRLFPNKPSKSQY